MVKPSQASRHAEETQKFWHGMTKSQATLAQLVCNSHHTKNDRVVRPEEGKVSDSEPADGFVDGDVMDRQEKGDVQSAHRTRSIIQTNVPVVLDLIGLLEKAAAGPSNKNILFRVSQIDKETVSLLKDHAIDGSFVFSELETKSRLIIKQLINASPVLNVLTLHKRSVPLDFKENEEEWPHIDEQTLRSYSLVDMAALISTLLPFDITPDDIDDFVVEEEERALADSGSSLQFGEKSDNLRMKLVVFQKLAEFETGLSLFRSLLPPLIQQ
ncbi:hypothetical protein BLNAU_8494 [Blattamonas nauphoetae]|uniref:Uncharacterized protein n=1 Tax=Blattamonas nauphoetae TaxID=2049346 RepID=A0ABQ9XYW3_9EUKA|nr:hypothetical protein BLNAU_8494 [Blattamonas nauphoetae]